MPFENIVEISFANIVGKCWLSAFSPFYTMFPPLPKVFNPFESHLICGLLKLSIQTFSHNVFYPSQSIFQFFSHIYFVVYKINAFNLDQILSFMKELNTEMCDGFRLIQLYQTTKLKGFAEDKASVT